MVDLSSPLLIERFKALDHQWVRMEDLLPLEFIRRDVHLILNVMNQVQASGRDGATQLLRILDELERCLEEFPDPKLDP